MIRFLLISLLGILGLSRVAAQTTEAPRLSDLFDKVASMEQVRQTYFGSRELDSLFSSPTFAFDSDAISSLSTVEGLGGVQLPSHEEDKSLFILSIPTPFSTPKKDREVIESLLHRTHFADCELVTLASEGHDFVRVYSLKPSVQTGNTLYLIMGKDRGFWLFRLKGHFALNSRIQIIPEGE